MGVYQQKTATPPPPPPPPCCQPGLLGLPALLAAELFVDHAHDLPQPSGFLHGGTDAGAGTRVIHVCVGARARRRRQGGGCGGCRRGWHHGGPGDGEHVADEDGQPPRQREALVEPDEPQTHCNSATLKHTQPHSANTLSRDSATPARRRRRQHTEQDVRVGVSDHAWYQQARSSGTFRQRIQATTKMYLGGRGTGGVSRGLQLQSLWVIPAAAVS